MNSEELKKKILDRFHKKIDLDKRIKALQEKIGKGIGTYEDASELSSLTGKSVGEIVIDVLEEHDFPEEATLSLLQASLQENHSVVSKSVKDVQNHLNEKARIRMSPVLPQFDRERASGLHKVIQERDKYSDFRKTFSELTENISMSVVDEAVRKNAQFQYDSGMSPKIRRTVKGKCCEWCSRIAGVYAYEDVKNTGNDVFRRHRCCRCVVEYIPYKGKAVNVHTKKEIPKEEKKITFQNIQDVTNEYLKNARKRTSITIEPGIDPKRHESEISTAKWASELFGGDITVLKDINEQNQKTPDYKWNEKYWELKRISSANSIDKRMKDAMKQLNGAGGIILECKRSTLSDDEIIKTIDRRILERTKSYDVDVMVKRGERLVKIVRKKK